MATWQEWSIGWLKEGHFIQYDMKGTTYYERVLHREMMHYEWEWEDTNGVHVVSANHDAGPVTPDPLEVTRDYDENSKLNYLWQMIFGIKSQVYIYVELPGNIHRHGIPKVPKPGPSWWKVSHFEEYMSPYFEPTFITEHFMMKAGSLNLITFSAYNNEDVDLYPWLNFFISAIETERIGTEIKGTLTPTSARWRDTLTKLYQGAIPCRPITLYGVYAEATG